MLVSAEVEVIFSAVASMRMCFGLVLNTELLYREPKTFLLFCTGSRRTGMPGRYKKTKPGHVAPIDKRSISDHVTS